MSPAPPAIALEVWGADADQVLTTAARADDLGFAAFYYGESPPGGPNLDCWTVLAAAARTTTRIRLGPVIANALPTWRHPALLAHQAVTVAALSGGRLDLRTGAGAAARYGRAWWGPHGVDYPGYDQRLSDLVALLDTLDGLGRQRAQRATGDRADPASPAPAPIPAPSARQASSAATSIPITIAATGPRALALAAARADVWETSFANPAELAERRRQMDGVARARPVTCSLEIDGFVASTPARLDRLLARAQADRQGEDLEPVLARALVGTPAAVAGQLAELAAAGADQLVVALHDPHDPDALESLAAAMAEATGGS